MADDSPRQLHMRRPHLEGLPELEIPAGYGLRTYQPGDEAHWARIMAEAFNADWTPERCRDELTSRPPFRPTGFFLATHQGEGVASACAWIRDGELAGEGTVHMVGALKAHRGRGLGRLVTLAVLRWLAENGFRTARLSTDDWREPAIAVYLKLGFEPIFFDAQHERRWQAVRVKMGARLP